MTVNNDFDIEFKQKMASIEKNMDDYNLDIAVVDNYKDLSDNVKMYLKEIGSIPRLTKEDTQKYAKVISHHEKVRLLKIKYSNNIKIYSLNIESLFSSLVNSSIYNSIIDSLLNLFIKTNIHEPKTEEDLIKYKKISGKLGRALNFDELKEYFNFLINEEIISEKELLNDVKDYITFKYSFYRFYVSNLRLVISVAKKYYRNNLDFLDLISEGNIGLLKAMQKYNPELGYSFSTYAMYWIMESIEKSLYKYDSIIRVPENLKLEINNFTKTVEKLKNEEGRELTLDEISEKLDLSIEKINEYYRCMFKITSLDKQVGKDKDISIIDTIIQDNSIDDKVETYLLKDEISYLLDFLNEEERTVIKLHFGIGQDGVAMSFKEIAKKLSLSYVRVKRIIEKALIKMRRIKNDDKVKALKYYMK